MKTGFRKLFEPARIGSLLLKNRIVFPPVSTSLPTNNGEPSLALIEWLATRARGGAGLIFVEATSVAPAIDPLKQLSRMLRLDDDGFASGLAEIAEAVHEAGGKVGIQLTPGFSSQARMGPWTMGKYHVEEVIAVGPSGVTHPEVQRPARELSVAEIEKIIELCGHSAAWAKQAGFDIIEIHAHSAFLIGQFLSPFFNRRSDKYGGTPERRVRFLLDVIDEMHKHVGLDFPLTVKYSVDEFMEGGRDRKEGQSIARAIERAGVSAITVSAGIHGAQIPSMPSMYYPEGLYVPLAEAIKEAVSLPVILPGRMGDPARAERALTEGKAEFIAWGRPLIADPDMPRKLAAGRPEDVRRCISCNECIRVQWAHKLPLRCTVNPVAGREHRYGTVPPAHLVKKVAVVGAGPAGMEAVRVAALRGHQVTLYDRSAPLQGGQVQLAAQPPHKDILNSLVSYYAGTFAKLPNVRLVLGKEVTADEVIASVPDAVIVATGAGPLIPALPIAQDAVVTTAHDLFANISVVGQRVLVVGGGMVGCEVANWLADRGKSVTIVEMLDAVATDVHTMVRLPLLNELAGRDVSILTGTRLEAITSDGAQIIDKHGRASVLPNDATVLCLGGVSQRDLATQLEGRVGELHIIGDAKQPRHIREAISEGFVVAFGL